MWKLTMQPTSAFARRMMTEIQPANVNQRRSKPELVYVDGSKSATILPMR